MLNQDEINYIKIDITKDCMLNCRYCPQKHEVVHFERKLVKPLVRFFKAFKKTLGVDFFGGEPILNFDVIKYIVEECKKENVEIRNFNLTTNGVLLADRSKIDYLAKNKFVISFSIDGPADVHLKNRKSNRVAINTHKIISNTIKYMNLQGYPYSIAAVFHKNTINSLDRSVNYLLGLTGDHRKIIIHPTIGFPWQEKEFKVLERALNRLVKGNPQYLEIYKEILCKNESDYICRAIYIDHLGYIYPTNLFSYKGLENKPIHLTKIKNFHETITNLKKAQLKLGDMEYDKEMEEHFKIVNFINQFFNNSNKVV